MGRVWEYLPEIYDRDAGTTELGILVAVGSDFGNGVEILTDELAKDAVTSSVKNAHAGSIGHKCIVDEEADDLHALVAAKSTDIYLAGEIQCGFTYLILRGGTYDVHRAALGLRCLSRLKFVELHIDLNGSESHQSLTPIDFEDASRRTLAVHLDITAYLELTYHLLHRGRGKAR